MLPGVNRTVGRPGMPLLVFCGRRPLLARLRSAAEDGAAGVEKDLARLVERIRERWPHIHIILRTDSGFCREPILAWCESAGVDYVIGLARNRRLQENIAPAMRRSRSRVATTGRPSRRFRSFPWRTRTSWSRSRRVIAKAEVLPAADGRRDKDNPRFLVTSLPASTHPAQKLYEEFYCARGDAENRAKKHKLHLFSKRCSSNLFDTNALRFMFSTLAYLLIEQLRKAMNGTELARASPDTLRLRLLRIGGRVSKSVRRIQIALSSAFPDRPLFRHAWNALAPPAPTQSTPAGSHSSWRGGLLASRIRILLSPVDKGPSRRRDCSAPPLADPSGRVDALGSSPGRFAQDL